jgi:hypothetical protein
MGGWTMAGDLLTRNTDPSKTAELATALLAALDALRSYDSIRTSTD